MAGVTLSAAVMAHRKRESFVKQLQGQLDADVPVVWDERNDRWDTGARSMLAADQSATHHVIIQDDAVLPRNFLTGLQACLEAWPENTGQSPLCLYIGRSGRYRHLVRQLPEEEPQVSWLTMPTLNWGVAVVFPTSVISDAVSWGNKRPDVPNWDKRLSRWFGHMRIPVWYTWPSLVDHRESPSLVAGRGHRGRTAQKFIGADVAADELGWSGQVVNVDPFGTGRVRLRTTEGRLIHGRTVMLGNGSSRKARPGGPARYGPRG